MSNKTKRKASPSNGRTTKTAKPASQPWGKRIAAGVGIVVVVAIVGVIAFTPEPVDGVPDGTETVAVGAPQHVEGEIHEEGEVPAGGEHNPVWLNCGYYDAPVESTRRDAEEFLALAGEIPITSVADPYPLADANIVLSRLRHGDVNGAAVLTV